MALDGENEIGAKYDLIGVESVCREFFEMSGDAKGEEGGGRPRTPPPAEEVPLEPVNGVVYPPTNPPTSRY